MAESNGTNDEQIMKILNNKNTNAHIHIYNKYGKFGKFSWKKNQTKQNKGGKTHHWKKQTKNERKEKQLISKTNWNHRKKGEIYSAKCY